MLLAHFHAKPDWSGAAPAQWDLIVVDGASALLAGAVVDHVRAVWCGPMRCKRWPPLSMGSPLLLQARLLLRAE